MSPYDLADGVRSYHGQPISRSRSGPGRSRATSTPAASRGRRPGSPAWRSSAAMTSLARRAWGTATAGIVVSPALLISDLGQAAALPEHAADVQGDFADERRLMDPDRSGATTRSPRPTTGWAFSTHRPGRQTRGRDPRPAALHLHRGARRQHGRPVWHEARRELPFVFGSGAALSAGAANVMLTPPATRAGPAARAHGGGGGVGWQRAHEEAPGRAWRALPRGNAAIFGQITRACVTHRRARCSRSREAVLAPRRRSAGRCSAPAR